MAYDQQLAERIRILAAGTPRLTEQKMFGGLAFLVGGNMAVAASGQGGLMVRVDPVESAPLTSSTPAREMEMRGRPMPGWLRIDTNDLRIRPLPLGAPGTGLRLQSASQTSALTPFNR